MKYNNMAEMVEEQSRQGKKNTALYYEGKKINWRELNENINKTANGLVNLGIKQGDRVAIMLPNVPEFVYTFFALQKIGAVAVPFNTMYKGHEITHILKDSGARAIVCQNSSVPLINEMRPEVPELEHIIITGERSISFIDPDSNAIIQMVFDKNDVPDLDGFAQKFGNTLVETLNKLGVEDAYYKHIGGIRVKGKKIANFNFAEMKGEGVIVCTSAIFLGPLYTDEFFQVVWVPPEVKDKMLEPLTSVEEETGVNPGLDKLKEVFNDVFQGTMQINLQQGKLSRDEEMAFTKQITLSKK